MKLNLKSVGQYTITREPPGNLSIMSYKDLQIIKKSIKVLGPNDRKEILARIQFFEKGFQNCYVMKVKDTIAYMQWLINPSENYLLEKYFKKIFYPLHNKQVMIENAFTYPKFRGYGYLPYVSQNLLDIAQEQGYKSVVGYIKINKIPSLNDFYKMGFKVTQLLRERKLLGSIYRNL